MDIPDPSLSYSNSVAADETGNSKNAYPNPIFNYNQTNDGGKLDEGQNGFETVMKGQKSNYAKRQLSYDDPPNYNSPDSMQNDGQNGFEAVMKGYTPSAPSPEAPKNNYSCDDDDQNGYEAVLRHDDSMLDAEVGVEVEPSFDQASPTSAATSPRIFTTNLTNSDTNIEDSYEEDSHGQVTQVIDNRGGSDSKSRKKPLALLCICCLLIALAILLAVFLSGVMGTDNNEAEDSNNKVGDSPAMLDPTSAPAPGLYLPDETWDAIENDPSGPQKRAFDWFWQQDMQNNTGYTSERMLQRFTLATFYFATQGETWTDNTGWLSSEHECNWFSSVSTQPQYYEQSVTACRSNSDALTNLVLINNNLVTDRLPEELYLLSNLRQLDLEMNHIKGPLSPAIQNLTQLARLRLSRNEMTSTIPSEIGDLSQLQVLSLYTNRFNGTIPDTLGGAQDLIQIWLSSNKFTGSIPTQMGKLTELQVVWLDQNELVWTIPTELGGLPKLQDIMLHENNLKGSLPSEFGLLGDYLVNLDLRSNELQGSVPSEMGKMIRLKSLTLHDNLFSGSLPTELGLMQQMETMYISSNRLTGTIPTTIANCDKLKTLWLNSNPQLTGPIPSEMGQLSQLQDLFLSRNALFGTLPSEIGLMVDLRTLALEQNVGLQGRLPAELAQVRNLKKITLGRTGLSGTIPADVCTAHEDALRFDCSARFCGCGDCVCPNK